MSLNSSKAILGLAVVVVTAAAGVYALLDGGKTVTAINPSDTELVALGERIYQETCAACHGINLEGQPNWPNPKRRRHLTRATS